MVEKGINLKISDFKDEIVNLINSYNLPAIVVKQVMGELYNEVCVVTNNTIQKEVEEYQKGLEQENEKERKKNGK